MLVTFEADGRTEANGSALIMHNERLADPLDEIVQAIAAISKKRNKTIADHEEIGRLEFYGGLYSDPIVTLNANGDEQSIGLPAWNLLRCLQDGARRHKRGPDVLRGVFPLHEFERLDYEGPRSAHGLWTDGTFALRKTVGVQRARTVRTRPIFNDWRIEWTAEVDPTVFDLHTLATIWRDAGVYAGIGDMRPVYGRFAGSIREGE